MPSRMPIDEFKTIVDVCEKDITDFDQRSIKDLVDQFIPTDEVDTVCRWMHELITRWILQTQELCEESDRETGRGEETFKAQLSIFFLSGLLLGKKLGGKEAEEIMLPVVDENNES